MFSGDYFWRHQAKYSDLGTPGKTDFDLRSGSRLDLSALFYPITTVIGARSIVCSLIDFYSVKRIHLRKWLWVLEHRQEKR